MKYFYEISILRVIVVIIVKNLFVTLQISSVAFVHKSKKIQSTIRFKKRISSDIKKC